MAKEILFLRCNFTPEEISDFSKELARKVSEVAQAEENKKAAVAQFSEQIAGAKAKCSQLARNIDSGYEMRNVDCRVDLDTPVVGTASIVRTDTNETVKTRAMNADELQQSLPLALEENKAAVEEFTGKKAN